MTRFLIVWSALLVPAVAFAQTATPQPKYTYEVSFGVGGRSTNGALSTLPEGASAPSSGGHYGTIDLASGFQLSDRFAAIGVYDLAVGGNVGVGTWGTMGIYGAGRVEVASRFWLEAGAGAGQLGYQPPEQTAMPTTRYWAPSGEGAAEVALFRTPDIALNLLARATTASFSGLRVQTFSIQIAFTGWH